MFFEVSRKEILEVLNILLPISERRTVSEILSHFLLESGDTLDVFATDLQVFAKASVKAKVKNKGSATVSAKEISALIKEIEDEAITIRFEDNFTEVQTKDGDYKFFSLPPSEFPKPPKEEFSPILELSSSDIKDLIEKTYFAASRDEGRYVLRGVLVELGKEVRFTASDGHRLSTYAIPHTSKEFKFVVPSDAISDIRRIVSSTIKTFYLEVSKSFLKLSSEGFQIWMKTIDEEYPNWREVFPDPSKFSARAIVKTDSIKKALKRVSLFSSSKFPYVKISMGRELRLQADSPEKGRGESYISADFSGKPAEVQLSYQYLMDALSSIDAPLVSLKFYGPESPILVEPVSGKGAEGLIMPIRV